jgi:hypothetical protein
MASASGTDQVGKSIKQVVVHQFPGGGQFPINGQWNDGQPAFIPGSTVNLTVPGRGAFFTVSVLNSSAASAYLDCDGSALSLSNTELAGSQVVLENGAGAVIPFDQGTTLGGGGVLTPTDGEVITPTLSQGKYVLGLQAVCTSPQAINDPSATYGFTGGMFLVEESPA